MFSVIAACRVARERRYRGIALLFAPVVVLAGGTYVHAQQYTLVSIFALLVFGVCRDTQDESRLMMRRTTAAAWAIILLTLHFVQNDNITDGEVVFASALATLVTLPAHLRLRAGAGAFAGTVGSFLLYRGQLESNRARPVFSGHAARLAWVSAHARTPDEIWAVKVNEGAYTTALGLWAVVDNIPVWCGLALICWVFTSLSRPNEPAASAVASAVRQGAP